MNEKLKFSFYNFYPLPHLSDVTECRQLIIFREKFLDLGPKSVCAVEMTMYVHWTCTGINSKDLHASMISINGKEMSEEYACIAQF